MYRLVVGTAALVFGLFLASVQAPAQGPPVTPSLPVTLEVATAFDEVQLPPGDVAGFSLRVKVVEELLQEGQEPPELPTEFTIEAPPEGVVPRVKAETVTVAAQAPPLKEMTTRLPREHCCMGIGSNGKYAYLLGGTGAGNEYFSDVLRFDPYTDQLIKVGSLPLAVHAPTAVWSGTVFYLFGGSLEYGKDSGNIMTYDPATNQGQVLSAMLPVAARYFSAAWDGRVTTACPAGCAYVMGGGTETAGGWVFYADIYRFNPVTDEVIRMDGRLPTGRWIGAAEFDGRNIYYFGGEGPTKWEFRDEILRYDPFDDVVETMGAKLTLPLGGASIVWDGLMFDLFGGMTDDLPSDYYGGVRALRTIHRYNPAVDVMTVWPQSLDGETSVSSAIWAGLHAYVFGGRRSDWTQHDEIYRFTPIERAATFDAVLDVLDPTPESTKEVAVKVKCGDGAPARIPLKLVINKSRKVSEVVAGSSDRVNIDCGKSTGASSPSPSAAPSTVSSASASSASRRSTMQSIPSAPTQGAPALETKAETDASSDGPLFVPSAGFAGAMAGMLAAASLIASRGRRPT